MRAVLGVVMLAACERPTAPKPVLAGIWNQVTHNGTPLPTTVAGTVTLNSDVLALTTSGHFSETLVALVNGPEADSVHSAIENAYGTYTVSDTDVVFTYAQRARPSRAIWVRDTLVVLALFTPDDRDVYVRSPNQHLTTK